MERRRLEVKRKKNTENSVLREAILPVAEIAARREGSVLGHGTTLENAKSILEEGLAVKYNDIQSTIYALFEAGSSPDTQDETYAMLKEWPYGDDGAIVIIIVPPKPSDYRGTIMGWINQFAPDVQASAADGSTKLKRVVPKEYIMGYLETGKNTFVRNDHYNPVVPTDYPRMGDPIVNAYEPPVPEGGFPVVTVDPSDEGDEVW